MFNQDFQRLIRELGKAIGKQVSNPLWNHIDFAFAIEGKRYVYDEVIDDIKHRNDSHILG